MLRQRLFGLFLVSLSVTRVAMAVEYERIAGSVPEGRETVLDRVVHLETDFRAEIPPVPRECDRMRPAGRRIDVGDVELYVEDEGEGPALVLLHGGPGGTHHYFHPWFSRAASFARVIYFDQRGCGLSEFAPGDEGYSVEQAVSDLDALRRALGLDRWVLFGYSYGGLLAQLYTVQYPEHVAGLILQGAVPGVPADDLGPSRQEDFVSPEETARKEWILEQARALRKTRGWSVRETMQLLVYNWGLNGDWKRQHFLRPTPERLAQRALYEWDHDQDFNAIVSRTQEGIDLTGAFDDNPIPTLVLEGEWDLTWGIGKRAVIAANHPRARHLLFENAGHNIYEEQTDAFFTRLSGFLGSLPEVPQSAIDDYREAVRRWSTRR